MSNILHVKIKDFQSLKDVDIKLTPGITIITGPTNNGKSAIIRAIDSALFNKGDDSMVRGGKRYYGIKMGNNKHAMMFVRDSVGKNEKTSYQFDDGTVQKKVGRDQLPEVAKMFNIRDVKMNNGVKMKINFWYQNDKPFLMDKTSGQLYEFLSMSSCDNYAKVLKLMNSDIKSLNEDIQSITNEIDTYKSINNEKIKFVDKNDGFDNVYERTVTLENQQRKLERIYELLQKSVTMNESMDELEKVKDTIQKELNRIDFKDVKKRYETCVNGVRDVSQLTERINKLKDLEQTKNSIHMSLERLKDKVKQTDTVLSKSSDAMNELNKNEEMVNKYNLLMDKHKTLERQIEKGTEEYKKKSSKVFKNEKEIKDKLQELAKTADKVKQTEVLCNSLRDLIVKGKNNKERIEQIKESLKKNEEELNKLKEEVGYCPFCGSIFK